MYQCDKIIMISGEGVLPLIFYIKMIKCYFFGLQSLPPHGGNDPGKIGVDDSLEKDLNLIIAKKVQKLLEQQDVKVVMTRETDAGLYEEQTSNKKVQDMKNRCTLINDTQPDCVVSIHQNSYHEEYVTGAQVFYYGTSQEGQRLAETLQKKLVAYVDPENHRQAKANESYYLLKKTEVPIVIVEYYVSNGAKNISSYLL